MSGNADVTSGSHSVLQIENEFFRVVQWTIEPGGHIPMHVHAFEYVVIPLTGGTMHVENADGTHFEAPLTVGVSYSRPAGSQHSIANRSETESIIFVEVERLG